jgi:hypothetical protein
MSEKFEIKGLREVEQALKTLPAAMHASILKSTNRDILNKFIKPQLKNLPYQRKKFLIQGVRNDKTGVVIGISSENYWLRYIDKGTDARTTKTKYKGPKKPASYHNKHRGQIEGTGIISAAITSQESPVIKDISDNYSAIIEKHLNRKLASIKRKLSKL